MAYKFQESIKERVAESTLYVQLDELADMLAFGLSIVNQMDVQNDEIETFVNDYKEFPFKQLINLNDREMFMSLLEQLHDYVKEKASFAAYISLPLMAAGNHYSIDQLITAYKQKMERNHARQDGTADQNKGYV